MNAELQIDQTWEDLTVQTQEPDSRAVALLACLKTYANEAREDGSPQRGLFRQLLFGAERDFRTEDLPTVFSAIADFVRQPDLDKTALRFAVWVNCDLVTLEHAAERLRRLRPSVSGELRPKA